MNDNPIESSCWLISYCVKQNAHTVYESVWRGSIAQWRLGCLSYEDNPYIILSAIEISQQEFKELKGQIG